MDWAPASREPARPGMELGRRAACPALGFEPADPLRPGPCPERYPTASGSGSSRHRWRRPARSAPAGCSGSCIRSRRRPHGSGAGRRPTPRCARRSRSGSTARRSGRAGASDSRSGCRSSAVGRVFPGCWPRRGRDRRRRRSRPSRTRAWRRCRPARGW